MHNRRWTPYINLELVTSKAFVALTPAARVVLLRLYLEIRIKRDRRNKQGFIIQNQDDIRLPWRDINQVYGYKEMAIYRAFRQLTAMGFIEVVHRGGRKRGDCNVYGIRDDWRKWKPGDKPVFSYAKQNARRGWARKFGTKKV